MTEYHKPPVINTIFWLAGEELNLDELTHLMKLQPTWSGKKGELSSIPMAAKRGVRVQETFWRIEIERNSYSMDEGIQEILRCIWPQREQIRAYVNARPSVTMGIKLVIHIGEDRPVYEISLDSIRKMADLGCSFMIDDIYPLEDSEA